MALIRFSSQAAGEIFMFEENARTILDIIGKDYTPRGIVTAAQLPHAIAALHAAIEQERRQLSANETENSEDEQEEMGEAVRVHLGQRAYPLIDMFERAERQRADVLWGV
ncbi:MAG TPA: DUF1840 domain-containing protein [Burkholderiaceae bacterium]|nr:DUF1840 domain-containing protein [Burkholderiaceae bacterium]